MVLDQPLVGRRSVGRCSVNLNGRWLRGGDAFPITLRHSRLFGTVWSMTSIDDALQDRAFIGYLFADGEGTKLRGTFGSEDQSRIAHVHHDSSGNWIQWPAAMWRQTPQRCCLSPTLRRMSSQGNFGRALWFRLVADLPPQRRNFAESCAQCSIMTYNMLLIMLILLLIIPMFWHGFLLPEVLGLHCPEDCDLNISHAPAKWSNCTQIFVESLLKSNCPANFSDSCFLRSMFDIKSCGMISQLKRGDKLTRFPGFSVIAAGCCCYILILAGSGLLYRAVALDGLAPGSRLSEHWFGPGKRFTSVVLIFLAAWAIAALWISITFAVLSVVGVVAIVLALAARSLRNEMQVLVEPPQHWPCVAQETDTLEVVRDFNRDCVTESDLYDFTLEVLDVFRIENSQLQERHLLFQNSMAAAQPNIRKVYHGTTAAAAKQIAAEGFRLSGNGGFLGDAIYFAETPLKSGLFSASGVILVCDIALGDPKTLLYGDSNLNADDLRDPFTGSKAYDTLLLESTAKGGCLTSREYAIFEMAQAVPKFLLKVREHPKGFFHTEARAGQSRSHGEEIDVEQGRGGQTADWDNGSQGHADVERSNFSNIEQPGTTEVLAPLQGCIHAGQVNLANNKQSGSTEIPHQAHVEQAHFANNERSGITEVSRQQRSHHQRKRERNWRNSVQIPTPEPDD